MARAADDACERLRQCLTGAPEDLNLAPEIAAEIGALRTKELIRLVQSIAEVRATLTPEQREILARCKF